MSVLFSDIRPNIMGHSGFIDKYIGDAIYEVFNADAAEIREIKCKTLAQYTTALQHYHQREWTLTAGLFQAIQTQLPDDRVLQMYCKCCADLLGNPPDENWVSITRMTSK